KYALVRPDPADDPWLRRLLELVPAERVISGIGEQPAVTHLRDFGLGGYTSGCVCEAPALSTRMLAACRAGDWTEAERIRELLRPLEDLRNAHHPVRVLHEAVRAAGIAETGPLLPLLHPVTVAEGGAIRAAALALRAAEAGA
ncbi:MAG TPA: dihydrodipicolinate synthase family protein, partial [Verrucomicrobiota bacterium]|nr:dihydrodipicolinate synthase family protein [Verrucomicrobiota bacterium]